MSKHEPVTAAPCDCDRLDSLVASAIADELVNLTTALSDLAFDLGSDPATVRKHMKSLQAIDLITQIHVALADFLRSGASVADRVSAVPVEGLAERLAQQLGLKEPKGLSMPAEGIVEHFWE